MLQLKHWETGWKKRYANTRALLENGGRIDSKIANALFWNVSSRDRRFHRSWALGGFEISRNILMDNARHQRLIWYSFFRCLSFYAIEISSGNSNVHPFAFAKRIFRDLAISLKFRSLRLNELPSPVLDRIKNFQLLSV